MESATGERIAARAKARVLYHIEISHYNEKVRWALDYKGIPHVRKAPPPLLHTAWALWLTRSPTFPVLKLDGDCVGDSTRIIATLEREHPEPPLYPRPRMSGAGRSRSRSTSTSSSVPTFAAGSSTRASSACLRATSSRGRSGARGR